MGHHGGRRPVDDLGIGDGQLPDAVIDGAGAATHSAHHAVSAELRSWYVTSAPAMGLLVERRPFGVYTTVESRIGPRVFLRIDDPGLVAGALADIRATYGNHSVDIYVDERAVADVLDGALVDGGCTRAVSTVYLALVSEMPAGPVVAGMTIQPLIGDLTEWARVRLLGFSNSETEPPARAVADDAAGWQVEAASAGRFVLAKMDGEPAAVLAYYDGDDRLVFNLATRVPYRGRGIAKALLWWFAAGGTADGCRSLCINGDEHDWPVTLYRRLGFVDEVLWHRRYLLPRL